MSRAILLEAESFPELGGWVVDQEFMDQMGSPFVLAHGLGRPVADAVEKIQDGRLTGDWRLWVRTRDWVSPHGPGRFTVQFWKTNETGQRVMLLETKELGVGNGDWHWEDCGVFSFSDKSIEIRLHDLTGFEGRCDALMFVPIHEGEHPGPSWAL